jgi:50S ribosomal subunit-associated GTPase HflX
MVEKHTVDSILNKKRKGIPTICMLGLTGSGKSSFANELMHNIKPFTPSGGI